MCAEFADGRALSVEHDWVRLNSSAAIWLDVADFEGACALADGQQGQALPTETAERLRHAVRLYQGELLEGGYQDWCVCERERLQSMYLGMLDKLIGYCEAHAEYETGVAFGEEVLRIDRARERTHRRLMRLRYLDGDRTAALRQFERCQAALREELGVAPAASTVALHRQIQADRLDAPPEGLAAPAERSPLPELTAEVLGGVLAHLKDFEAVLSAMQGRVQRDLRLLEAALTNRR